MLAFASKPDVRFHLDLDPDLGAVAGDEARLGMAILNISFNALDAMPQRGTLTLRTRNIGGETGKGTGIGLTQVRDTVLGSRAAKSHGALTAKPSIA